MNQINNKGTTVGGIAIIIYGLIIYGLIVIGFWVAVIFTGWHFIHKYW